MLERFSTWSRRVQLPRVARAPLGFGTEYWDLDAKHYEGWEELRDRRTAHGVDPVIVGKLARGKDFEPGTPPYHSGMTRPDLRRLLA